MVSPLMHLLNEKKWMRLSGAVQPLVQAVMALVLVGLTHTLLTHTTFFMCCTEEA